jgi:hypothetical protein
MLKCRCSSHPDSDVGSVACHDALNGRSPRVVLEGLREAVSAIGYLNFLAKNTMLGATPNEVAALILKNELIRMSQAEKDRPAIPQA